jgi:excisionase family DNA binding protein
MADWLTVEEVAERLRVSPRTVRGWLQEGRLKGRNLGDALAGASARKMLTPSWRARKGTTRREKQRRELATPPR